MLLFLHSGLQWGGDFMEIQRRRALTAAGPRALAYVGALFLISYRQ